MRIRPRSLFSVRAVSLSFYYKKKAYTVCVCMLTIALYLGLFFVVDAVDVCWGGDSVLYYSLLYYVTSHLEEEVSTSDVLIDMGLCVLNIMN